jgi:hypothetical protein
MELSIDISLGKRWRKHFVSIYQGNYSGKRMNKKDKKI